MEPNYDETSTNFVLYNIKGKDEDTVLMALQF
jgi:hypothetical protein